MRILNYGQRISLSEKKRTNSSLIFLLVSLLFLLLMLMFYGMDVSSFAYRIRSIMALAGVLFYIAFNVINLEHLRPNVIRQMILINNAFLICSAIILIDLFAIEDRPGVSDFVSRLSFVVGFGLVSVIEISNYYKHKRIDFRKALHNLGLFISNHVFLIILTCVVSVYLLMTYNKVRPMWDSALLYRYSSFISSYSLYNFSSTFYFGHISYTYAAIVAVLSCLSNNTNLLLSVIFSLAYLSSVCCFYGTLKIISPGSKDAVYSLSTAIYAFSPFTIGLIHDPYLDLLTLFLFTVLIYFYFSKQYCIATVIAVMFLFTKEPAVIELGFFILGLLIVDLINNRSKKIEDIMAIISQKKYIIIAFVASIWFYIFLFVCHWEKSDGIEWTPSFVFKECKVIVGLNFNWLLLLISILFIVFSFKNSHKFFRFLFPLCCSFIAMWCFLIFYPTHNHPRYLGAMIAPLYLMACAGLCAISKEIARGILQVIIAIIVLVSTYKTIDPISRILFQNIDIGTDKMVTTNEPLSDSTVYNSQYEGYQKCLNIAISEVLNNNPDAIICLPAEKGNVWYYDALGLWQDTDSSITITEYYDNSIGMRYSDYQERSNELKITFVTPDADFNKISAGGEAHLLYLPFVGTNESSEVYKHCVVEREDEFSSNGWTLHDLVFK